MKPRTFVFGTAVATALGLLVLHGADAAREAEDRLRRHRNLGKAFYESPTGATRAVEEFRAALDLAPDSIPIRLNYGLALIRAGRMDTGIVQHQRVQKLDPKLPHTWFNLGITFKKQGRLEEAIQQLENFVRLVPEEPVSHYNLGLLYDRTDRADLALKQFQLANRLDASLVAPYFQIYNSHRLAGRQQEAAGALQAFREAKKRQEESGEIEDMEWNYYSEIYDVIESAPASNEPPAQLAFKDSKLPGAVNPATAGLLALDADGDGKPDLLVWSQDGIRLYRNGSGLVKAFGMEDLRGIVSVAPGDFDNDGLTDLCILTESGAALFHNEKNVFRKANVAMPPGRFEQAVWIDYDHDYDLDLFLFGQKSVLLRNQGIAGFVDDTADFPFVSGHAISAAKLRVRPDAAGLDLIVSYRNRGGVLYRDRMRGSFRAEHLEGLPPLAHSLTAFDIDNDGWMDVAFAGPKAVGFLANRRGMLEAVQSGASGPGSFVLADLENRGTADLVLDGAVYRNMSASRFGPGRKPSGLDRGRWWSTADFNGDGRVDLAAVLPDGSVHLFVNQTETRNHWMGLALTGVKNLKMASGSEIEVRSGAAYQKKFFDGVPLVFGFGPYREADTVRIVWPNGMIQNETRQPADRAAAYKEAPRLSGSCPMVFAWNGREFEFITDVLGVAPLGASSGDGGYFPVDHDEYVQISKRTLVPVNGQYEVRVTEELREVTYLDKVQLIAADHLAGIELFTNEKFKSPPFPEFRLFGVSRRSYPVRATDSHGHDVQGLLLRKDRKYPDDFRRDHAGVAEMHALDLDFGSSAARENRSLLVLNGWVDWADGSTFLRISQERGGGLVLPYLQVKDASGAWRTVIEDIGIPSGKPKAMVVDLTGKFLSASREVRIVTNVCVYWDEIFLSEETGAPAVHLIPVRILSADLHFRGFSLPVIHSERKQPEMFDYSQVTGAPMWNPTAGFYTRYGDVRELLESIDDRYVIMGSGDELRLRFPAASLPAPPAGWTRDFLLLFDGWAKDRDANTAFAENVEPLPFHAMSRYPYPEKESYPRDRLHEAYRSAYNTRPASRMARPLR